MNMYVHNLYSMLSMVFSPLRLYILRYGRGCCLGSLVVYSVAVATRIQSSESDMREPGLQSDDRSNSSNQRVVDSLVNAVRTTVLQFNELQY